MSRQHKCKFVAVSMLVISTMMVVSFARAQELGAITPAPEGTKVPSAAATESSRQPTIQRWQFETFADLVRESDQDVLRRLKAAPELIPLAAAAAQAVKKRERRGKIMTGLGFTILGAGVTVGALVGLMGEPYFCDGPCTSKYAGTAVAIDLISAGVGLALVIPGILTLAGETDIEKEAVDRYHQKPKPEILLPLSSPRLSNGTSGRILGVPLLSLSF